MPVRLCSLFFSLALRLLISCLLKDIKIGAEVSLGSIAAMPLKIAAHFCPQQLSHLCAVCRFFLLLILRIPELLFAKSGGGSSKRSLLSLPDMQNVLPRPWKETCLHTGEMRRRRKSAIFFLWTSVGNLFYSRVFPFYLRSVRI